MKNTSAWLDYLKFRGSVGAAGNAGAINAFTRYDILNLSNYLGNTAVYPTSTPANPDVQWEETFTLDAGAEVRFFKDRVRATADIYKRKTSNMVYTTNLASVTGYSTVLDNIGNMENRGVELSISIDVIRNNNLKWSVIANWSTNKNKLVKANLPEAATLSGQLINKEGENFNSFYLKKWDGVNMNDGKPQWWDSTGKLSSDYNAAKREIVGKPQPDAFGAITNILTYKGVELTTQLYYQYGYQIYDNARGMLLSDGSYPYVNQLKESLNYWKKQGDVVANPRRLLNNGDKGNRASTRYLFDGDYLRLKYVSLAYIFPRTIVNKLRLNMLRIFVQGNNLALWTKFSGQDPESVDVGGNIDLPYPNQRSFSVGLNVSF
jgi:hypothetical protein